MKDYTCIDLNEYKDISKIIYDKGYAQGYEDALNSVSDKVGFWEMLDKEEWYGTQGKCSLCGHVTIDIGHFCPKCGVRMDNGEIDD